MQSLGVSVDDSVVIINPSFDTNRIEEILEQLSRKYKSTESTSKLNLDKIIIEISVLPTPTELMRKIVQSLQQPAPKEFLYKIAGIGPSKLSNSDQSYLENIINNAIHSSTTPTLIGLSHIDNSWYDLSGGDDTFDMPDDENPF